MILRGQSPCASSPTISSVGTPTTQTVGNCAGQNLTIRTSITLSGNLQGTQSVQKRTSYQNTGPSSQSWSGWSDISGWSGSSGNYDYSAGLVTTDSGTGTGSLGTYYYDIEIRILGSDDSTVCDGPDTTSQWSATVYSCFA